MTELQELERKVELARASYETALSRLAPGARAMRAKSLRTTYAEALREYTYAVLEDARSGEVGERATSDAEVNEVLIEVTDSEWNVMGLTPLYFAQRVQETTGATEITEADFFNILANDRWVATKWVAEEPPFESLAYINAQLSGVEIVHEVVTTTEPIFLDEEELSARLIEKVKEERGRGEKRDRYSEIRDQMIERLEAGVVPWHQPWASTGGRLPKNMTTENHYQGANAILLGLASMTESFTSPYWGTFKQIEGLGGSVVKGQHGTPIRKWISFEDNKEQEAVVADNAEEKRRGGMLKFYTVFNYQQTTGLSEERFAAIVEDLRTPDERFAEAENAVAEYLAAGGPKLELGFDQAYFSPSADLVAMPNFNAFKESERYYSTLFHELTHSTGHASRLAREGIGGGHQFGSEPYAREELVAEMGAAFATAMLGIASEETEKADAAYLANWINVLKDKDNRTLIFDAASAAQRAVEHIGISVTREICLEEEKTVTLEVEGDAVNLDVHVHEETRPDIDGISLNMTVTEGWQRPDPSSAAATRGTSTPPRRTLSELIEERDALREDLRVLPYEINDWKVYKASAAIATLTREIDLENVPYELIACEDEIACEERRIEETIGHKVLGGKDLAFDMELVQAEVARQERILSFQRDSGGDPKLFACRVLERARCDALVAIRNARPLSDEKERLQIVKTGMDTEYELLTKNEGTLEQYAEVIARIEKENEVNQEWLSQQKAELERLAMREIERDIPAVEFNYGMSR